MSPSTNQIGSDTKEYDTEAERMIDTKPKHLLLSIKPQSEELAREWLGATHKLDADKEIKEHFAAQVRLNI